VELVKKIWNFVNIRNLKFNFKLEVTRYDTKVHNTEDNRAFKFTAEGVICYSDINKIGDEIFSVLRA